MKGSYILVLFLKFNTTIRIGRLGNINFKRGFYFYIGSAMGTSGSTTLLNRVKRHLSSPNQKRNHWHIDYLLENESVSIIKVYLIPCKFKLECKIAQEFVEISDEYVENFGSSDCDCKSHLIYFKDISKYFP